MDLFTQYGWVGNVIIGMLLAKLFGRLFGVSVKDILSNLVDEVGRLAAMEWNCRSINAMGLIVMSAFGVVCLLGDIGDRLTNLVMIRLGEQQAQQLRDSISPSALFFTLVAGTLVSTFLVRRQR